MNIPQSNIRNMLNSISSLNHVLNETLRLVKFTTVDCPDCGYDPIRRESIDPTCPTCGGAGVINTAVNTDIPSSIETSSDLIYSFAEVGRLVDGEVVATIDNLEISTILNASGQYSMDNEVSIKAFLDQYDHFEWKGGKYVVKSFIANYLQGTFYELQITLRLL